jgi:hypothetical protein
MRQPKPGELWRYKVGRNANGYNIAYAGELVIIVGPRFQQNHWSEKNIRVGWVIRPININIRGHWKDWWANDNEIEPVE